MGKAFSNVSPAIKKETINVAIATGVGVVIMWAVIFALKSLTDIDVPFDYTVFLGGIGGFIVAVINFFWMGLTVQKVANQEDEKMAQAIMRNSYRRRFLLQIAWIVVVLFAPVFFWATGMLPLLFPSASIKLRGFVKQRNYNKEKEVEQKQDGC